MSPIDMALCEATVRVFNWGNDLAVQIAEERFRALDPATGGEIDVPFTRMNGSELDRRGVPAMTREQALERIRASARPLPAAGSSIGTAPRCAQG